MKKNDEGLSAFQEESIRGLEAFLDSAADGKEQMNRGGLVTKDANSNEMNIWMIANWWIPNGNLRHLRFEPFKETSRVIEFGLGPWDKNFDKLKSGDIVALRESQTGYGSQPLSIIMVAMIVKTNSFEKKHIIYLNNIHEKHLVLPMVNQDIKNKFIAKVENLDVKKEISALLAA